MSELTPTAQDIFRAVDRTAIELPDYGATTAIVGAVQGLALEVAALREEIAKSNASDTDKLVARMGMSR